MPKFATCDEGCEMANALDFLDSLDLLAQVDCELRTERAPKGALKKALEAGLDKVYGSKNKKEQQKKKSTKEDEEEDDLRAGG